MVLLAKETGIDDVPETVDYIDESLSDLAKPWPRFWARLFDVYLLSIPAAFIMGLVFPALFVVGSDGRPPNTFLIGAACLPLVLLLDAFITSVFGTTPGKALAGLHVADLERRNIGLETSLKRNALVWFKGLALGVPIIALFTYKSGYDAVKSNGLTSWDESTESRVFNKSNSPARTLLVGALALAVLLGLNILDKIPE